MSPTALPHLEFPSDVGDIFPQRNPLATASALYLVFTFSTWLVSIITGNYSQIDRLWSIIPVVYVALFANATKLQTGQWDEIGTNLAILVGIWGARLTYNFARKYVLVVVAFNSFS